MHSRPLYRLPLFWLLLAAFIPYIPLLRGEFLFDDIQVIQSNPVLKQVTTLGHCFSFVLKPSKPVTNFLLAVGQWLGHGDVFWQRLLSLLCHVTVVALLYLNLRLLLKRFPDLLPAAFPFWVSLLFALAPIHTESLGIALFRMDVLGTLFTWLAVLAVQKIFETPPPSPSRARVWYVVLFLSMGLGPLSKEVFAVVLPVSVALIYWQTNSHRPSWRTLGALVVIQALWGVVLYGLLLKDGGSEYPYAQVIGRELVEGPLHIRLAASALLEGLYKTVSGHDLTIVRLLDREGLGKSLGTSNALAVLALGLGLGGWLVSLGGLLRLWGGMLLASVGIYLAIPNLNIGSEHYWYAPAAPLLALLTYAVWRLVERYSLRPYKVMTVLVGVYAVALIGGLEARLGKMGSRLEFYLSEAQNHPETAGIWSDLSVALMEKGPTHVADALPFLRRAKALDATHPNVLGAEFLYFFHRDDLEGARRSLPTLEDVFRSTPKALGRFHFHYGILEERAGNASQAALAYLKALEEDPKDSRYQEAYDKVARKD